MLPPVPSVHAEDDPGAGGGQKTVKRSSFSSFGSSIHSFHFRRFFLDGSGQIWKVLLCSTDYVCMEKL